MKYLYKTIIVLTVVFTSCSISSPSDYNPEQPAEGDDGSAITGTGDIINCLFIENNATYIDIDEEDTITSISDLKVDDVFTSTTFGKENYRDELPLLISTSISNLELNTALPTFFETPTYVGAFGTSPSKDWYTNSNWFLIDPSTKTYNYNENEAIKITGEITNDITLFADKQYLLVGQVFVKEGSTVTIEAGTVIFGSGRTGGTEPGVLIINRGAKILAEGTPDKPIVFTSTKPVGQRDRGDWGGLVLLGRAPNNKGDDVTIEGIDATGGNGQYGGNDPHDNSGTLKFVRIEYAGIALSPGNEINTLTLGSIGDQTQIDHIITSFAGDDAYEWFGGNVNLHHIVAYNTLDDDFDTDAGYSGNVQFAYVLRNELAADISGSKCFESTTSKNAGATPITSCTFSNVTAVGSLYLADGSEMYDPQFQNGIKASNFSNITLTNSIVLGCPIGAQNY
ncbi:hypothetical protein [Flammeovirga kamogawensis]|uniref:T9SS C-terminal target domain-containing protein n=1 Tax=Flammeovirga kamogawensis TaxID=373891 RepID=A0ABX8H244_9BACT|nr:hypothetical protein [Flammeovirga kamogawensis]MBB6460164.1 hypothetical protein [Flammeovirga kamogawensis]QWG09976.1 hypothetical protein KM029_20050 [Flammeovirga kamogawensis]TRX65484.1 hypothetical protein EO216_23475 [Flammeovirga kamogawensis]